MKKGKSQSRAKLDKANRRVVAAELKRKEIEDKLRGLQAKQDAWQAELDTREDDVLTERLGEVQSCLQSGRQKIEKAKNTLVQHTTYMSRLKRAGAKLEQKAKARIRIAKKQELECKQQKDQATAEARQRKIRELEVVHEHFSRAADEIQQQIRSLKFEALEDE